jgi:hypothetical protein
MSTASHEYDLIERDIDDAIHILRVALISTENGSAKDYLTNAIFHLHDRLMGIPTVADALHVPRHLR